MVNIVKFYASSLHQLKSSMLNPPSQFLRALRKPGTKHVMSQLFNMFSLYLGQNPKCFFWEKLLYLSKQIAMNIRLGVCLKGFRERIPFDSIVAHLHSQEEQVQT